MPDDQETQHAPCFVADAAGVAVLLPTVDDSYRVTTAQELRALADAADALQVIAKGARMISVPTLEDAANVVANDGMADDPTGHPWVLDLPDHDGAASLGTHAWLWKLDGAPGRIFASSFAPAADTRIRPACPRDFPQAEPTRLTKARTVRLMKGPAAPEQRLVTGIVLEPETVDSQGDIYSADEIASAAHRYLEQFQVVGHMHETALPDTSVKIAESYLAPVDLEINGQPVKAGTWLMVVHVLSDGLWEQVKRGDLTGFSIGGMAQRVPDQTST